MHCVSFWLRSRDLYIQFGLDNFFPVHFDVADVMVQAKSSSEDLGFDFIRHIKHNGKNYLSQIECADLENEAKTTRKATNLSVNSTQAVNRQPGFRLKDS